MFSATLKCEIKLEMSKGVNEQMSKGVNECRMSFSRTQKKNINARKLHRV